MMTRRALVAEQEAVETLSQTDKSTKEFKYLWRRYKNWADERSRPIVAAHDDDLFGFHAAAFGALYVNSYYQLVAAEARGRGVGGQMVEFLLREAQRLGCRRLKFKVPPGSEGQAFWEGFGLRPIGADRAHLLYDASLDGVSCAADLARSEVGAIPEQAMRRYERSGVRLSIPIGRLW